MSPPERDSGVASGAHLDEEECLPFPIFIAELELLVGNSKRGKPDGVQLLELLQKLVATIPRTDKAVLKQHQRQCEAMLYDVLAHGIGAAVRRLIYSCFSSLYAHGDSISIYTRVNTLQGYLASKEGMSRSKAEAIRVGLLDFLTHLYLQYGRMLGNSAQESITTASRTLSKSGNQAAVRCAALRLAAAVVRGLLPGDRSAPALHTDTWLMVQRNAKDRTCEEVRAGCLSLLSALCVAGGGPLWRDGAYGAEEAVRLCLGLADDPSQAVRDAAYNALGELAAASRGAPATDAVTNEKRPAKKVSVERVVTGCVRACLVAPLLDAAVHGRREACLGVSGAWMSYVSSLPRQRQSQDQAADLLEVATMLISTVNEAGRLAAEARTAAGPEGAGELGAGLAGSELPPLQASALYVLRRGVMAALAEAAQRKLLERLAGSLEKRLTTPAAVVTLEALGTLLEAVGEVADDTAAALEHVLQPYVTSSSAAARQQAAATMAALATAHPAAAARMLSGCLDTVASCAAQMAAPLSMASNLPTDPRTTPAAKRPATPTRRASTFDADGPAGTPSPGSPPPVATPNGVAGSGPSITGRPAAAAPQRALMDTCHGAALAASRLLLTTARAPLGCPARLQRRALALAEDLVEGPGSELAGNRAICREVGFLLLGTLCSLGLPQSTRGLEEMVALWQVALGEAARKDLDERSLLRPGGELDLAVQLWWRAVALQALSAYVATAQAAAPPASALTGGGSSTSRNRSSTMVASASRSAASFSAQPESGLPRVRSGSAAPGYALEQDWADLAGQLAPLVQPLLELLDTQAYLQDPARAKGGPAGILAGAAAMFTLSLLELHLRVPGARIVASSAHVALLVKACLRPFRLGVTPAAGDALKLAALRGLLSTDDAPLGPWPAGVDPHEDALRAFTGGRGAPQLPPWLTAEEYAGLVSGGGSAAGSVAAAPGSAGSFTTAGGAMLLANGYDGDAANGSVAAGAGAVLASAAGPLDATGGGGAGGGGSLSCGGLAHATYPQPLGLEAALLTAQLVLLGRLLGSSPIQQQLQILEVILIAVQAAKAVARQSRDAAACRSLPLGIAAAVAVLAAYGPAAMAARRSKAPLDPTDKVSDKLLQLAQTLLPDEDAASPAAAPLSRATAEVFAASAATGSDTWALRVVRALAGEVAASAAEGRDSQQRAVIALALGAVHRARGGLAMQGAVASSAEALVAAASRPGCPAAAAWIMHGLWLVACSGGGAFVPRVKTSLQLGQELLVSSFESAALRAACARLANASVAVLGPEFSLGSLAYSRAKSLVAASGDAQAAAADGSGRDGAADGAADRPQATGGDGGLGLVLFVQQIILFAPHAVPAAKHVPLLLAHLLSRQPDLRAAAALTLRHLAERSAEALRPAEAAPLLFAALDSESDVRIAGQLRATLTTVLTASVAAQPSFWLELLSDVVFAAGQPSAAVASTSGSGEVPRGGDDDDDDKYGQAPAASPPAASKPAAAAPGGGAKALRSVREVLSAPHLRTRHFAADCLLRLVRLCVAADERHRDSSALEWQGRGQGCPSTTVGGEGGRADLLIRKLQVLVDVGFKLATCPLESLRPHGVRMLTLLVQLFGDVPDPLLQGARLMEQYQAQVVSALRSSLSARQAAAGGLPGFLSNGPTAAGGGSVVSGATAPHPLLQIAGGVLATCFLESGLAAGDALVMRRLMELLSAPLSSWQSLRYEPYAEWVGARARVELLRAHAQCSAIAAAAAARGDSLCAGIVAKAHEPHAARLQTMWALLLQDHAVLCSQHDAVLEAYRSPLLDGGFELPAAPAVAEARAAAAPVVGEIEADGVDASDGGRGGGGTEEGVDAGGAGLTPALAAVLRPVYAAACPAALAALAGLLPPPAELAADAAARARFRLLLEVGLMLLTDAAARLAHAVHDAVRGTIGGSSGGASATTSDLSQVRDAAARLAGVLRALQRLLAPNYVAAVAVDGSGDGGGGVANGRPAAGGQPLVPPAVLRDVLTTLGATAAHALLPLHRAVLGGQMAPSLGGLLSGLALPCCTMVRELCGAAPEECLGSVGGGWSSSSQSADASDDEATAAAAAARRRSSVDGGKAGPRGGEGGSESYPANGGEGCFRCRDSELGDEGDGEGSTAGAGTSVTAAGVEAILLFASVCVPYAYSTHGAAVHADVAVGDHAVVAGIVPYWLLPAPAASSSSSLRGSGSGDGLNGNSSGEDRAAQDVPGCVPLPAMAAEHAAGLVQCAVQALAAAQQLIRRAPWRALEPHVGPLLELPLRLILTSTPGTPVMTAAQRYLDTATSALVARAAAAISAAGSGTATPDANVATATSPIAYAAAAVVALTDVTALHVKALGARRHGGDGGGGSSESGPTAALLQGRLAALVQALLTSAAALDMESAGSRGGPAGSVVQGRMSYSAGSGPIALHQNQRSQRGSSAGSSRLPDGASAGGQAEPEGLVAAAALSTASVRGCALAVLAAALAADVPAGAALVVLEAARAAVQEVMMEDAGSVQGRWGRALVFALTPPAVERVAALLAETRQPLAGPEQSLVAECLKLLVLAATLAGPQGGPAQEGVMQVLVPLLVEVAAPAVGPAAATPALRDMAVRLITSLPAAAAGAAFKAHLAAQPAAAKLRLQGALREAAAAAVPIGGATASGGAAAAGAAFAPQHGSAAAVPLSAVGLVAGAGRRPAIQLKTTFALPLPSK